MSDEVLIKKIPDKIKSILILPGIYLSSNRFYLSGGNQLTNGRLRGQYLSDVAQQGFFGSTSFPS